MKCSFSKLKTKILKIDNGRVFCMNTSISIRKATGKGVTKIIRSLGCCYNYYLCSVIWFCGGECEQISLMFLHWVCVTYTITFNDI